MRYVLWLDAERDPATEPWRSNIVKAYNSPHSAVTLLVVWCRTYDEFVEAFTQRYGENTLVAVWFDNNLGGEKEGWYPAFSWMENHIREGRDDKQFYTVFDLHCHATNPIAQEAMERAFDKLWIEWEEWCTEG